MLKLSLQECFCSVALLDFSEFSFSACKFSTAFFFVSTPFVRLFQCNIPDLANKKQHNIVDSRKKQEQPANRAAPAKYSVTHSGLRCRHPGDTDLYGDDGAALPLPISPPGAHTDSPSSSCSSARQWTGSPAASSGAESAYDNRLAVGFAHPASAEQVSPGAPAQAKRHCSSADAAGESHTRRCASAAADPPDAQPDDPHCALPVRGAVPPSWQPHAVSSGTA